MPVMDLTDIYQARKGDEGRSTVEYVVVLRVGTKVAALSVDRLLGQQEIVVKSLVGHAGRVPGIAAASVLGDGRIVLILDAFALLRNSQRTSAARLKPERIAV